jgi:hypothetical protein
LFFASFITFLASAMLGLHHRRSSVEFHGGCASVADRKPDAMLSKAAV